MNLTINEEVFNSCYLDYIKDLEHKYFILVGGAGSGKSKATSQKVVLRGLSEKGIRILIVRKTFRSIKDSCFKEICTVLKDWKIYHHCRINHTDFSIVLPNGSEINFKGMDDSEKLKSIVGYSVCMVEEATEISESDYDQICLRIRNPKYKNQIYMCLNPVSKANWIYKRFFQPGTVIPDDTYILKTTWRDNKFLSKEYIETIQRLKTTSPTLWKIYSEGQWTSLSRTVYENWRVESFDRTTLKGTHCVGLDFGFVNDLTALVDMVVNESQKIIYVCRCWSATGKTNSEIASAIKSLGLEKSDIVCDSAEPKSIEELKRAGIYRVRPSKKGPDSIMYGIQRIQQYTIVVHPSCELVVNELENYTWEKNKEGELINKPADFMNHSMDAMRYGMQLVDKHTIQTFDRKLLGV